jgi:hypothetical protein
MFDEWSRHCFQVGLVFAVIFSVLLFNSSLPSDTTGERVFVSIATGFGLSSIGVIPTLAIHYLMMTYRNRRGE